MKEEIYELTFPQNNIWLVDRMYSNTNINVITGFINIKNDFNIDFCKEAINKIIENNDAMRINIILENDVPYQKITKYSYVDIKVIDMENTTDEEREKYIHNLKNSPIDIHGEKLYEFYILKYSNDTGAILLKMHHIVSDAWSFSKIIEQFIKYYGNKAEAEATNIPSYIEFIASTNEYKNSEKYKKDEEFWNDYLGNIEDKVSLKDAVRKINNSSIRYNVKLDESINNKILEYCKENKISPYVLFLSALATYIYRIKDKNDIVIGTPSLNRANFKEKQMIGMFVSTLPLRIKVEENIKFIDLAREIARNTMNVFRHQRFPFINTLKNIRNKNNNSNNLYSVVLSYQNARVDFEDKEKYSTKWYESSYQNEDLQIHILDMDNTGVLEINYDYLSELFEKVEIEYLHTRIMAIIENAISNNEIDVENIEIMSKEEKDKILYEFNDTFCEYPKDKSVIDLFEEQVEKTPDNIALIFEDKQITYRELNERANAVAHYLVDIGIKPNDIVAIIMKRSNNLIVLILAIMKCRASYLPIDSTYPLNRIEYILKNSKSTFVITDIESPICIEGIKMTSINFDELILKSSVDDMKNLSVTFSANAINYLMYTSGSTGNPKGVAVSVENLVNFVLGINKTLHITDEDRVVSITTISFDIFGLELWVTLLNGATVILANEEECTDGNKLSKLCLKYNATVIQTTPTKLKMLLNNTKYVYNMKKILLGGEKVPKDFIDRLKAITKASIYDVYGPTETTIWSTIQDLTNCTRISVGKPIANTRIYILNKKNKVLPIGVSGQVAIAGDGVSLGYYNNEKITEKNYIYSENIGERIYLTGDLGKFNFDSTISILDRIDLQIKLNGQRIELEDIERNILLYPNIKETAVILKQNRILVCYYKKICKEDMIDKSEIVTFLYNKLPTYMVPTVYIELDKFPLTLNGKTDRKTLAMLDINNKEEVLYQKPKTKLQNIIYSIWVKVLEKDNFGINDRFFEIGADSLCAIKVQIELLSYGIHLEYKDLLRYQSIKELEKYIMENKNTEKVKKSENVENFSNILSSNKKDILSSDIKKSNVKNILLTGVTGFLGMHILDSFMKYESGKIYCIIREKNNTSSMDRFIETLHYYFGNKYDYDIGKRIFLIEGNFFEDDLGIKINEYENIINDIDLVIHSAACVKHYGDANYFKTINVDGTEKIAKFCFENNKKLMHISTISVSGNSFEIMKSNQELKRTINFDETCFYQEQNLENIYVYTKFKAEEVVLEYIKKGLKANILRIGNLTGRYEDLRFQSNINENAFSNRIKTFIEIGCFPISNSDVYLEFTPVDLCANAIIKIMQYFNISKNMFHLYNDNHISIEDFSKVLNKIGIKIDIVSDKLFIKRIEELIHSKNNQILNGIINDLDENNRLNYNTNVKVRSDYTKKYLKQIGFEWKDINENYLINYIKYLRKIGFLNQ